MSECTQKALEFLNACPAEMQILYAGTAVNHLWNDKEPRDMFSFVIKTQRGTMNGIFWDSLHNTRLRNMTFKEYYEKCTKRSYDFASAQEKIRYQKELKEMVKLIKPTPYSILACLEKYEVGSMDDFMHEFGYEIKSAKDMANFIQIYNAVVKEYNDLCRIFTPKQMETLREIW